MTKKKNKQLLPLNDQLYLAEEVYYDCFYFGSHFLHKQITSNHQQIQLDSYTISSNSSNNLTINPKVAEGITDLLILEKTKVKTITVNRPKQSFLLSSAQNSAIQTATDAMIMFEPIPDNNGYQLKIYIAKDRVYYNDKIVDTGEYLWEVGQRIVVNHLIIELREKQIKLTSLNTTYQLNPWYLIEEAYLPEYPIDFPNFRRSPRIYLKAPESRIDIAPPKPSAKMGRNDLLQSIVPPLGMIVLSGTVSYLSGGNPIMMLGMGSASLIAAGFSCSNYFTNKREVRQQNKKQTNQYEAYVINQRAELSRLKSQQLFALNYMTPSIETLALMVKEYNARIFERQRKDTDFLTVRLGTGMIKPSFSVAFQSNKEDLLTALANEKLIKPYQQIAPAPIIIPLANQTVGMVGLPSVVDVALQTILFQIAVLHSYRDVEFVTLISEEDYDKNWQNWRWLPHMKLQQLNLRGFIYDERTRDLVLHSFYQILVKRRQQVKENKFEKNVFKPHYILSIKEEAWLTGHGLNEFLSEDMTQYGVTVIWIKESRNMLPETTTTLIEYQSNHAAILVNQNKEFINQDFSPNQLPTTFTINQAIQRLANLHHVEVEKNIIPTTLSLLEQYKVNDVEELQIAKRWLAAEPNKSIRSLIGWKGKGEYVYWDLHERVHGPHALVGGTTGSGKSEFLMTYLIGLAINFSPEDIGILIIDWKGGGIANFLEKLPHFMGAITNLDDNGTQRALVSIKAELQKRQRYFAQYGVNNINDYMRLYKQGMQMRFTNEEYPGEPLPHLILVSDEFAELKANVPEFLTELTSVARIGRSLGVHLILATQKPTGVVNDQIEANSTTKIALKMANTQDSNELLKTPDAAQITNPGRGYLKVGENEVYELFQSGYSSEIYDPDKTKEKLDERIYKVNTLGQTELLYDPDENYIFNQTTQDLFTQLEAVIQNITVIFNQSDYILPAKPWLPNLKERLITPLVKKAADRMLVIPLGKLDIPSEQKQSNYDYNLETAGHTMIISSPRWGKSTIIQTIAMNLARLNTPEQIHFYLLDFGNNGLLPLQHLPHVADIVSLDENEKLQKMLTIISNLLSERKLMLKNEGVLTIEQYEIKTKHTLPIIVIMLDNYDALTGNIECKDNVDDILQQIVRDGASLGCFLIISSNSFTAIRTSLRNNIATKFVLNLNEESECKFILGKDAISQQAIAGRGQILLDKPVAIQFYLPTAGDTDIQLLANLEKEIQVMNKTWHGSKPSKIPMVPSNLTQTMFNELVPEKIANHIYLGLDKNTAKPVAWQLFNGKTMGIFMDSKQQYQLLVGWFISQFIEDFSEVDVVIIDMLDTIVYCENKVSEYWSSQKVMQNNVELKERLLNISDNSTQRKIFILNGLNDLVASLSMQEAFLAELVNSKNNRNQLICIDYMNNVGRSFGWLTTFVKENFSTILFGGDLTNQRFAEFMSKNYKNNVVSPRVLYSLTEGNISELVIPSSLINQ